MARYVLDQNNNKIEVTDEILNTTVEEVKCCVSGTPFKMAFVRQATYNVLAAQGLLEANTLYEIIDDATLFDIDNTLTNHSIDINNLKAQHFYEHNLTINFQETVSNFTVNGFILLNLITNNSTAITNDTLRSYITLCKRKTATGYMKYSGGSNSTYIVHGITYLTLTNDFRIDAISTEGVNAVYSLPTTLEVVDTVRTI